MKKKQLEELNYEADYKISHNPTIIQMADSLKCSPRYAARNGRKTIRRWLNIEGATRRLNYNPVQGGIKNEAHILSLPVLDNLLKLFSISADGKIHWFYDWVW